MWMSKNEAGFFVRDDEAKIKNGKAAPPDEAAFPFINQQKMG